MNSISQPIIQEITGGYKFLWCEGNEQILLVTVERVKSIGDTICAEISLEHEFEEHPKLRRIRINLLAQRGRSDVTKRIIELKLPLEINWADLIEQVSNEVIERIRQGEPVVPVGKKPESMKAEYQLTPILEKNQPTTLYGPGGSAKSYMADYIAVLVQLNILGIANSNDCWIPAAGNVLLLDWEASQEDHARRVWAIKAGLGTDRQETFLYRFCSQSLVGDIDSIQNLVFENKIDLVIIDSQMAASGYGTDAAQVASQFYNALRSLRCTTLTLDHVSKEDWKNYGTVGPYGSVVKYNRSRSQFEIRKSQNAGEDFLELSLIHRKHNEGKLLKPIGIRIKFNENTEGQLESVTFESCNVADNPELSGTLSARDQIVGLLKHGKLEVKAISEELAIAEPTIRARLNGNKRLFKHFADGWGLLE